MLWPPQNTGLFEFKIPCCKCPGGSLWSWGNNTTGQLALGTTGGTHTSPTQVGTDGDWLMFTAADGGYVMAIKTSGSLWGCGSNASGQLGLGDTTQRTTLIQVGTATYSYVSSGTGTTLAIKSDGTLWSCGDNTNGQLGYGTFGGTHTSLAQVGSDSTWVAVSAPSGSSFGIKSDGTLWAWGNNSNGRLGLGDTTSRTSPVQVGTGTDWAMITGGGSTLAIKTNGTLWAWGANSLGQLGLGDTTDRHSPVQVGSATDWSFVDTSLHTVATKTDGTLWACGNNSNGQLGLGTTGGTHMSFVQVGTDTDWSTVSASLAFAGFTTAVKTSGDLYTWGFNSNGQLGLGDTTQRTSPAHVGSDLWLFTAAGDNFTFGIQ